MEQMDKRVCISSAKTAEQQTLLHGAAGHQCQAQPASDHTGFVYEEQQEEQVQP